VLLCMANASMAFGVDNGGTLRAFGMALEEVFVVFVVGTVRRMRTVRSMG